MPRKLAFGRKMLYLCITSETGGCVIINFLDADDADDADFLDYYTR